ncbi:MAG: hypothetical protein KIT22_07945 [Verrucomicrobiae bacterium]|nr:hypothetical protein [Verrucomicrobiae bacterium]
MKTFFACWTTTLARHDFISRYLVALPKPEDLQRLIGTDRTVWEQHHSNAETQTD